VRKTFHQYFKPTETEFKSLWDHGLFSFDASVLLNVYGYSKETCEELVRFFERNAERVILPHQFALEFSRNRTRVIVKQIDNYLLAEKDLKRILEQHFRPKREHPFLSVEGMETFEGIREELAESRQEMEKLISSDFYCDRMLKVFEDKVGSEPSAQEYERLHSEAKQRYSASIPPGYCDLKEKPEPDAYGDYIAWRQLIQMATERKRDFVLAIDDLKEDWWQIEHERYIGPHPALLKEFFDMSGQRVYLYNSERFLRAAKQYGAADIGDRVLEEVGSRLASQRENNRAGGMKPLPNIAMVEVAKLELSSVEDKAVQDVKPSMLVTPKVENLKLGPDADGNV
jgi:hypothetical protein